MPDSSRKPNGHPSPSESRFPNPLAYWRTLQSRRFERCREDLYLYLEAAIPIALMAERLYEGWRQNTSEPIQDGQKAANQSAIYWWQIAEGLRKFDSIAPPAPASRYHKLFSDALRNAMEGTGIAKNGFRSNKFSEISKGLGFLDRYVELMSEAERELGRLLRKYRLGEKEGTEA